MKDVSTKSRRCDKNNQTSIKQTREFYSCDDSSEYMMYFRFLVGGSEEDVVEAAIDIAYSFRFQTFP